MASVLRWILLTALLAALAAELAGAGFRASVVKVDITPGTPQWLLGYASRKSTGVHDRLFHKVVAMDDGTTQFILISTDICLISPSEYEKVAGEVTTQVDRIQEPEFRMARE